MKKVIFLEGCQRSGNHLIAQWIRNHTDSLYMNNFNFSVREQRDDHLFGEEDPDFEDQLFQVTSTFGKYINIVSHGLVSYEHPGLMSEEKYTRLLEELRSVQQGSTLQYLHLLRDPYNWMASYARLMAKSKRFGWIEKNKTKTVGDIEIADNYARFNDIYWGRWLRSYSKWSLTAPDDRINYNVFLTDEGYRKNLALKLEFEFVAEKDQSSLSEFPEQGSSFDSHVSKKKDKFFSRYDSILPLLKKYGMPEAVQQAAKSHFPELHASVNEKLKSCD